MSCPARARRAGPAGAVLCLCLSMFVAISVVPVARAGGGPLWGESEEDPLSRYQHLCTQARVVLQNPRDSGPDALQRAIGILRQATGLYPEGPEGWGLLGRALLESGQTAEALPALRRAQQLGADDTRMLTSLALLQGQEGNLQGALELYRRLFLRGLSTQVLLRRTGDVLMALGRLQEAILSYERACLSPRSSSSSGMELARSCFALAVAYDRDERLGAGAAVLRRALVLDPSLRSLAEGDFLPPQERDYYRALVLSRRKSPCDEQAALRSYVARSQADGKTGQAYLGRARARLERLAGQCKEEYSLLH